MTRKVEEPAVEAVPLDRLHPAPWNPRTIKDERFQNLVRSIQADRDFLWRRPILATADGTIYAGNMRYRAAQHLDMATVPAIVEDIPEQLAKERALRDNHQWGDWQDDQLGELLFGLRSDGADLELLGFTEKELAKLLDEVGVGVGDAQDEFVRGRCSSTRAILASAPRFAETPSRSRSRPGSSVPSSCEAHDP